MASAPLESGRIIAGRYRVESLLGEGGMGSVYLVRHIHTEESLALKVVHAHILRDADAVERFRREARAPVRIASEHVVRVTDADTAPDLDNAPFIVMELLRGKDLERTLAEEGPLPPALVVEYLRQAARALDKAHAMAIVHRDLKPENMFVTHRDDGSPCVKLLDFGIARLADGSAPNAMKTQEGYLLGTPAFMSPEQAVGEVERIGPATDVWAIGLVAFRLLVARDFWPANSTAQLFAMILSGPIPAPSDRGSTFGPAFDAWFSRCVTRTIEDRFTTVGDAVVALAGALGVTIASPRHSGASLVAAEEIGPRVDSAALRIVGTTGAANSPSGRGAAPMVDVDAPAPARRSVRTGTAAIALLAVVALGGSAVYYVSASRTKPEATGLVIPTPVAMASGSTPAVDAAAGSAEPQASASAPEPSRPRAAKGGGLPGTRPSTTRGQPPPTPVPLTRDQRQRLAALERLCDQGTFTADECNAKRQAIIRGEP